MRAQKQVTLVAIALVGLLLTACQKKLAEETLHAAEITHSKAPGKSPLHSKDLGVLRLSNHISTTVTLEGNKKCTFTPTLLGSGDLQIILSIMTTGNNGRPESMNVARVLAQPGEPLNVSIGDMNLAFTPQLAKQ